MKYIHYIKEVEKYMDITNVINVKINGIQLIVGQKNIKNVRNVIRKRNHMNNES